MPVTALVLGFLVLTGLAGCSEPDALPVNATDYTLPVTVTTIGGPVAGHTFQALDFRADGYVDYGGYDGLDRINSLLVEGGTVHLAGGRTGSIPAGGTALREWVRSHGGLVPLDAIAPGGLAPRSVPASPSLPAYGGGAEPLVVSAPFEAAGRRMGAASYQPCTADCAHATNWKPLYVDGLVADFSKRVPGLADCSVVQRFLVCPAADGPRAWVVRERFPEYENVFAFFEIDKLPTYRVPGRCAYGEAAPGSVMSGDVAAETCLNRLVREAGERL